MCFGIKKNVFWQCFQRPYRCIHSFNATLDSALSGNNRAATELLHLCCSALSGYNRAATELLHLCCSALIGSSSAYRITCVAATKVLASWYKSTNTDQKCVLTVLKIKKYYENIKKKCFWQCFQRPYRCIHCS
jgi:hypothetical protein